MRQALCPNPSGPPFCPPADVGLLTSDQSRASHSGGQLWLWQGSVREGRRGLQAESSRTFSSVTEILLLHKTCRVRRPPLQLRLHSDHSPVHQLQEHGFSVRPREYRNRPAGGGARRNPKRRKGDRNPVCLTSGSTAQCCTIFSSLWVDSSCRRTGCRRLCGWSASCTPPAASEHLRDTTLSESSPSQLTSPAFFPSTQQILINKPAKSPGNESVRKAASEVSPSQAVLVPPAQRAEQRDQEV